ncbi:MAG: YggS family pyridoxal phosphate-dependent enzyme [Pseudomonadota bacterium]
MAGSFKDRSSEIQKAIGDLVNKDKLVSPTVIAVSKRQSLEKIKEAYGCGQRDFGENYWQEAKENIQNFNEVGVRWHLIGQVQSKKIKEITGSFFLIHSVSRRQEFLKIAEVAHSKNITQRILLQVNIAGEASKQGFSLDEFRDVVQEARKHASLVVEGMMVFPPLEAQGKSQWFTKSQKLFEDLKNPQAPEWCVLSMGTSGDYLEAMRFGATHLRIGESLMGPRS